MTPEQTMITASHYNRLVSIAEQNGISVCEHNEPSCRYLAAPEAGVVFIYRGMSWCDSFSRLAETLRRAGLGLTTPWGLDVIASSDQEVIEDLSDTHICVRPHLPFNHRHPDLDPFRHPVPKSRDSVAWRVRPARFSVPD